jgi:PIN domain nuclease of toxin-antitoxin system
MKLLLDTHIFLWFLSQDQQLPKGYRDAIIDPENEVYLSVVSLWEVIIKQQLGKLPLPQPAETYLPFQRDRHGIVALPVTEESVVRVASLLPLHRDPFDRLLIAQALHHGLTLVTVDSAVQAYPIATL